jgi:hypothetical protein
VGRGALIERGADRAWLEAALMTTVAGPGSLVLVSGEAGIGRFVPRAAVFLVTCTASGATVEP